MLTRKNIQVHTSTHSLSHTHDGHDLLNCGRTHTLATQNYWHKWSSPHLWLLFHVCHTWAKKVFIKKNKQRLWFDFNPFIWANCLQFPKVLSDGLAITKYVRKLCRPCQPLHHFQKPIMIYLVSFSLGSPGVVDLFKWPSFPRCSFSMRLNCPLIFPHHITPFPISTHSGFLWWCIIYGIPLKLIINKHK